MTINRQGLRAREEYASAPPDGKQRILLFGDSCAFGEEVDDDETVSHFLEQELDDTEVLNFGVHGYGMGQMLLRLEGEGFDFNPDHVLVMFLTHDYQRDRRKHFVHPKPMFRVQQGRLQIDNLPVPEASRQPWLLRHSFVVAWLWGRPPGTPKDPASIEEAMELPARILERIRDLCRERSVPLTWIHITSGPQISVMHLESERYHIAAMRRVLAESGVDTLDLVDFLEKKRSEIGPKLEAPHGHWSALGNRLIASEIARHLAPDVPD